MSFRSGKVAELILLVLSTIMAYYYLWLAMKGKLKDPLRMLPQLEAISDGVDKAVEEGRYVYVTPGNVAYLSGVNAPMTIAGMDVLRYTAKLCVRKGAKIRFLAPQNAETVPLIDGIFKEVCISEGHPEAYNRDEIRYYGASEASWSTAGGADVAASRLSLLIIVGASTSAELVMQQQAMIQNAMHIGGTARYAMAGTYAIVADFPLFCDDIYAAGAICSGSVEVAAGLVGGDVVKLGLIATALLFTVLAAVGINTWKTGGWLYL